MKKIYIVIALCAMSGVAHANMPYEEVMAIDHANKENQICVEYGAIEGMAMPEVTKNCDKIRTDTIRAIKKYFEGPKTHAETCEYKQDC